MNKIIMGLIVAVCVLGMALIMLNEKLGRKPDSAPLTVETPAPVAEAGSSGSLSLNRPAEDDLMAPLPAPMPTPAPGLAPAPAPTLSEPPAPPAFSFGGDQGGTPASLPPLPQAPRPDLSSPMPQEAPSAEMRLPATPVPPVPRMPDTEERKDIPVPSLASDVVAEREREEASPAPRPATPEKAKPVPPRETRKAEKPAPEPRKETAEKKETVEKKTESRKEEAARKEAPRKETPSRAKSSADKSIERFVVYAREGGATVRLVGNTTISYKPMVLTNPDRVVVDLDGDWEIKAPGVPKNELVTNVRIGKMNGKTRVVIDLKEASKPRYTLSADRQMLDVRVDK